MEPSNELSKLCGDYVTSMRQYEEALERATVSEDYVPRDADELEKYNRRKQDPDKFDQPMSKPNEFPPIIPMVVEDVKRMFGTICIGGECYEQDVAKLLERDLLERQALGLRRYGVALQARNGRDPRKDAYSEALDLCNYLRQDVEEAVLDGDMVRLGQAREDYVSALSIARQLRSRIKD